MFINNPGHMTKMAAMPIYGKKTFKILLLLNQWADFNKTWHEASGLKYYNVFINCDLWMTLTYFTARST